jgi:hypothetical protein
MFFQQVFFTVATLVVFFQGGMTTPLPKQHDAETVGRPSFDRYISACPDDKPDFQGGLCYKKCASGYKAVGPLCWKGAKNYGRGVGTVPKTVDNPTVHPVK